MKEGLLQLEAAGRLRAVRVRALGSGFLLVAVVAVLPFATRYAPLAGHILIFGLLAIGFDLLLGYTGLLSFAQGALFGAGAYLAGLTLLHWNPHPLLGLLVAVAGTSALASVIGAISIRRQGIYFIMLTLAFNEMLFYTAYELRGITGGENGLLDIPRGDLALGIFSVPLGKDLAYYYFVAVLFLAGFFFVRRLIDSPFGASLVAIRENEARAASIGLDVKRFKVLAFAVAGGLSGLAGGLFAMLYKFVPLENMSLTTSGNIIIMGLLGGTGTLYGPLLGAALVVLLSEFFSLLWARWPLILGATFILVVLFFRGGTWRLAGSVARALRGTANPERERYGRS